MNEPNIICNDSSGECVIKERLVDPYYMQTDEEGTLDNFG